MWDEFTPIHRSMQRSAGGAVGFTAFYRPESGRHWVGLSGNRIEAGLALRYTHTTPSLEEFSPCCADV